MISLIKQFFRRVKRTIDFLPIIWNGYDFDYGCALDLFRYQLERTADFLDSDRANNIDAKKISFRIKTATTLMQKVYNDEYEMEWMDQIQKEFGPTALNLKSVLIKKDTPGLEELTGHYLYKSEYEDWDNAEEIRERISVLSVQSREKQKKAERILWQWINHNIKCWWD